MHQSMHTTTKGQVCGRACVRGLVQLFIDLYLSDPQNCKIQKVPGYFLKTKLGIFKPFWRLFDENKGWSTIVSCENLQSPQYILTMQDSLTPGNVMALKAKINTILIVCSRTPNTGAL